MKKTYVCLFLVIAGLFLASSSAIADPVDLSRIVKDRAPVRVFLKEFSNESGHNDILASDFKKELEHAFLNRKSVKFEIAQSPEESDVEISGVIRKYTYSDTDPITTYASPSGFLLDAATTENYAEMKVDFTVIQTGTGKVLWQNGVLDFEKHTMTREQSIPKIYDKIARKFLWKCFGKSR